jgi:hypothetical protein
MRKIFADTGYWIALLPTFRTLNCHIRFLTPLFLHFYAGEATELSKKSYFP